MENPGVGELVYSCMDLFLVADGGIRVNVLQPAVIVYDQTKKLVFEECNWLSKIKFVSSPI